MLRFRYHTSSQKSQKTGRSMKRRIKMNFSKSLEEQAVLLSAPSYDVQAKTILSFVQIIALFLFTARSKEFGCPEFSHLGKEESQKKIEALAERISLL